MKFKKTSFLLSAVSISLAGAYFWFDTPVSAAPQINITDKTAPAIAELYNQYQETQEKLTALETERGEALQKNLDAMRETEQSLANRTLTAASTAATGLGTMTAASAIAEQRADAAAERDMSAYLETLHCEYANGQNFKYSPEEITLPGGNELIAYRTEYMEIAERLKKVKEALKLAPGLEAEAILDRAEAGLYDDVAIGKTGGAYASLANALTDESGKDAAEIAAQKEETATKLKAGAIAAGVGVVGGAIGNAIINKDAPKEESAKINTEYNNKRDEIKKDADEIEENLNAAIAENAAAVAEYNNTLQQHQDLIAQIQACGTTCEGMFNEYIETVNGCPGKIENETDAVQGCEFPDIDAAQTLLTTVQTCTTNGGTYNTESEACDMPAPEPEPASTTTETNETNETPETTETTETTETSEETTTETTDPDICEVGKKHRTGFHIEPGVTRVGDRCYSALVLDGVVIRRNTKERECGCSALRCETRKGKAQPPVDGQCVCDTARGYTDNPDKKKGGCVCGAGKDARQQCRTDIKPDDNGECSEFKIYDVYNKFSEGGYTDPVKFCQEYRIVGNYCKVSNAIKDYQGEKDRNEIFVCNPGKTTQERHEDGITNKKDEEIQNLGYFNVCDYKARGLEYPGAKESYCVEDIFNWTQTQKMQAVGLAKEYAKRKHNRTIECSDNERPLGNDDYIGCFTSDRQYVYEFKFDDVFESVDNHRRDSERGALCRLIGGEIPTIQRTTLVNITRCNKIDKKTCTGEFLELTKKFGHIVVWRNNRCEFLQESEMMYKDRQELDKNLDKIDGLDNYIMYTDIQIRGSQNIVRQLRKYVGSKGFRTSTFECNPGYYTIYFGTMGEALKGSDEVLPCRVNGRSIEFVFDDLAERWDTTVESGESAIECKINGGLHAGSNCVGLDQTKCNEVGKKLKERNPKSSGTWYDGEDCILLDANEQKELQDGINVSTMLVGVADCAFGTKAGCKLAAIEAVGMLTEMYAGDEMQKIAMDFIKKAYACKNRTCAKKLLKESGTTVNIMPALSSASTSESVDAMLAHLLEYLEPEDLNIAPDTSWEDIVKDLGGDPNDTKGTVLKRAKQIGLIAQFASLGASGLRLTRQALSKIGTKATEATRISAFVSKADKATDAVGDGIKLSPKEAKTYTNPRIAELEKKKAASTLTAEESKELKQLHNQREHILNEHKVNGVKNSEAVGKAATQALDEKAIGKAQSEYDKALKQYNSYAEQMRNSKGSLPRNATEAHLNNNYNELQKAQEKLKKLGVEVEMPEKLTPGKVPGAAPKPTTPKATDVPKPETAPKSTTPTPTGTGAPKSPADEIQALKNKADPKFDEMAIRVKGSNSGIEASVKKSALSDDEWAKLSKEMEKEGLEFEQLGDNMYLRKKSAGAAGAGKGASTVGKTTGSSNFRFYSDYLDKVKDGKEEFLSISRHGGLSEDEVTSLVEKAKQNGLDVSYHAKNDLYYVKRSGSAADVAGDVANVGKGAGAVNAGKADGVIDTLKNAASKNFDSHLAKAKASSLDKPYGAVFDAGNMNAKQWDTLNNSLKDQGLELVDVVKKDGNPGKRLQRIGAKFESDNITDAVHGASGGAKAAENTSKTTRAANLYENWKVAGKGRESYEFDFAVLGNNEKELSEFIGYVHKDGYYVRLNTNTNRIVVKDAFSDLYKRVAAGEKDIETMKDVLPAQRWEELNQRVSKLGWKFVDDGATGMKLVRKTPVKTDEALMESLRMRGWNGEQERNFYYMFIPGRSSAQHVTGLKFHISVDASDLDRATDIIGNSMKRSGIGGQFKVYLNPDSMSWANQVGKEFTVYVSPEGYKSDKLQQFVNECEQGLRNAGVKPNGFGSNVSSGDKAVNGSQYIGYRYDRTNNFGVPDGEYNGSYQFVAPKAEYGGDIMSGISVKASSVATGGERGKNILNSVADAIDVGDLVNNIFGN